MTHDLIQIRNHSAFLKLEDDPFDLHHLSETQIQTDVQHDILRFHAFYAAHEIAAGRPPALKMWPGDQHKKEAEIALRCWANALAEIPAAPILPNSTQGGFRDAVKEVLEEYGYGVAGDEGAA